MNDLKGKFPVLFSQQISWGDMDAFEHINNAVYFRYFEDARMVYFERAKIVEYKERTQIGPILASTRCDFRAPLTYPDTIQVAAFVEDIKSKRFTMKYLVYSERLGRIAAEGEGLIIYYDYRQEKTCEIPAVIRASIEALQSGFA